MASVAFQDIVPLINEAFSRGQTITIPVTGTSMMPLLRPKDGVTLAQISSVERGDILLYRRHDGQYVLHRVVEVYADSVDFCGDNQVVIEQNVPKCALIAQVISYEKDGKTVPLARIRKEGRKRLNSRVFRAAISKYRAGQPKKKSSAYRFFFVYLKKRLVPILLMCLCSCFSAVATLGMALASGRVIDKTLGGELHDFAVWFWILFALMSFVAVCNILYSNLRVRATGQLRNELRQDLFKELLSKQYTALQDIHSGEVMNRLTSDIQIVVDTSITLIPQSAATVIKLVGGLGLLLFMEPVFTSVLLVGAVIVATLVQFFGRFYKALHKQCQETEGKTRSYLQECLENMLVIKSFVNDQAVVEKLGDYQQDNFKKQVKRNLFANIGNTAIYTGFTFAYYAGLAWGILRVAGVIGSAAMSVGLFATLLQLLEQIRAPFRSATGVLPQIMAMLASAERLHELMLLPDEKTDAQVQTVDKEQFTSLQLSDVSFAYEDDRPILVNASATLKKGEFAVLVGTSGMGKTTIVKLLLGLVLPDKGTMTFTADSQTVPITAATRRMFSFVPQGNMLLSGTLRENITFGSEHVTEERLSRVLSLACLTKVIQALPNGIHTVIGERGYGLSEGQLQRVAIARALLSDAPVLLLDECTSALDEATEKQVLANLRSLTDRTILFISHRPAVLQCADCVWTIQDGEIHRSSIK
ncbi:MAG: ATP-binding cassette domain-containing protein [Ruminococcaceae bacterium]|nr:ATP-binding cassette domain-containing protein [Oscillospiraceae bacterium]